MTDTDLMPFGRYRTVRLEDVPARYLLWLWNQGLKAETASQGQRGELARFVRVGSRL